MVVRAQVWLTPAVMNWKLTPAGILDGDWDARVGGGVVTQLPLVIQPPAVGLTSGSEGAGVFITSGNLTK